MSAMIELPIQPGKANLDRGGHDWLHVSSLRQSQVTHTFTISRMFVPTGACAHTNCLFNPFRVALPNCKPQVTHTFTINPKCIKMGELYGEYNLLTNEWTDGLGSTLIRSAVADTAVDRKWVVLDGPVDAIWIENMNTGVCVLQIGFQCLYQIIRFLVLKTLPCPSKWF